MRIHTIITLSLSILLLAACRSGSKDASVYEIDLDAARPEAEFAPLVKIQEEITIDPSLLISSDLSVQVGRKNIVLLDMQTNQIHVLDRQGRLVHTISRRGNGPGEYSRIAKLFFDEQAGQICITDPDKNNLLIYNLEGEVVEVLKFEFASMGYNNFTRWNGNYYIEHNNQPADEEYRFALLQADGELQLTGKYQPYETPLSAHVFSGDSFWTEGQDLLFFPRYSQTVYQVFPDREPEPSYSFSFGRHDLNREELFKILGSGSIFMRDILDADTISLLGISQTSQTILANTYCSGKAFVFCVDRKSLETRVFVLADREERDPLMYPVSTTGDCFVAKDESDPDLLKIRLYTLDF